MMEALQAGGIELGVGERRDSWATTHSDIDYSVNPNGLYELDVYDFRDANFPSKYFGKAIKVLWMNLTLIHAVADYYVVYMLRDPEEIRQSFLAAFNKSPDMSRYEEINDRWIAWLRNRRDVTLIQTSYRGMVKDPIPVFDLMCRMGWDIDPVMAASAIKPELCRYKRESLTEGVV